MERKKGKKITSQSLMIIVLSVISALCLGVTGWLLWNKFHNPSSSDYAAMDIDPNAKDLGKNEPKNEAPQGGGSVTLTYSNEVEIEGKKVRLSFENPKRSTKDLVLQLIIPRDGKDVVVAQSQRVKAGFGIYELTLKDNITLHSGAYEGKFALNYYDDASNEKAVVNTDIPVKISVK